jgi:hypothetical protein
VTPHVETLSDIVALKTLNERFGRLVVPARGYPTDADENMLLEQDQQHHDRHIFSLSLAEGVPTSLVKATASAPVADDATLGTSELPLAKVPEVPVLSYPQQASHYMSSLSSALAARTNAALSLYIVTPEAADPGYGAFHVMPSGKTECKWPTTMIRAPYSCFCSGPRYYLQTNRQYYGSSIYVSCAAPARVPPWLNLRFSMMSAECFEMP